MTAPLPDSVTLCIGVGAQKAGTTWLATYFESHPSIFMSRIKELHYFDSLWIPERMAKRNRLHLAKVKQLARDITLKDVTTGSEELARLGEHCDRLAMVAGGHATYLEYFAKRVGDRPVAAEITPEYALLDVHHFREIRSIHPRMKAVFLMRNPVDRVWSAMRHLEARRGFDVEGRFDDAISWRGMQQRSDYGRTLRALDDAFRPEDVFVEFYEALFTEDAIRRLCDFLAVPYHRAPFDKVVNKATDRKITAEQRRRLGQLLRPVYEYCHERFGERLPEPWRADLKIIAQGV